MVCPMGVEKLLVTYCPKPKKVKLERNKALTIAFLDTIRLAKYLLNQGIEFTGGSVPQALIFCKRNHAVEFKIG